MNNKFISTIAKTLEKKQKIKFLIFTSFAFIIMILETFSLGMFYPFLQSITDNQINTSLADKLLLINNYFDIKFDIEILALFTFALLIIFKNVFNYYFEFWQLNFIRDLKVDLKNKMLKKHFEDNYEKISNIKTSEYIREFSSTINIFIATLQNIMQMVIEIFVFVGIIILLIIIQSTDIIYFIFSIGFIAILFVLLVKNFLRNIGEKQLILNEKVLNKLLNILNSTKEIIIFNKYNLFTKQFKMMEYNHLNLIRNGNLIQKLPKHFFEVLVVFSFAAYIFFINENDYDINTIIPQLGVFFLALIRLLPGVTKIIFYFNKLKHAEVATLKISRDINIYNKLFKNKIIKNEVKFKTNLILKDITFKYQNREKTVLENLDFELNKGDYIGIVGSSGGGKSTLIDIISGLLKPSSGKIFLNGNEINDLSKTNWVDKIGYLPQENKLLDDTILTNITFEFDRDLIDFELLNNICKKTGLDNLLNKLEKKFDTQVGENGLALSGGEKQRIGISRLLYAKKDILIFDESTSNLDIENKEKFINILNNFAKVKTVILISHDPEVIKNCSKKFKIDNKKILEL